MSVEANPQMAVQPISPEEFHPQVRQFPDAVILVFNALIRARFADGTAILPQGDIVAGLMAEGIGEDTIFGDNLLDVEPLYRRLGWLVSYSAPKPPEDADQPFFTFRRPRFRGIFDSTSQKIND